MEISTLLFIFIGLLVLVAFIVVFNMKRGQSAEGKYVNIPIQQPTNIVYDSTVVFDLFKMRIENGIEHSLEHARELEGKLVVENTGISEFEYDAMTKKAHLKTELQFVGNYITHYCDEKKYKNLSFAKSFINEACKLLGHKDAAFSKFYYYLQKLISMLDANEDILKIVDAVHSNLEEIVLIDSNDISISSIIHNIKDLDEEIDAHQKHFSSNLVKHKVEAFTAVSDKCFDIQNEIENRPEPWVPELFVWNSIIVQIKEKLKTAASELKESPDFEVAVFNTLKQIEAEGAYLTLRFEIKNRKHSSCPINQIELFPETNSNDIKYKGPPEKVNMSTGQGIAAFDFELFMYSNTNYVIEIEYRISYLQNASQEFIKLKRTLPKIVYKQKITNPFEDGTSGKPLEGGSKLFFGRRELLDDIATNFNQHKNSATFLLVGMPRSGKTSILKQLQNDPKWLKGKYIPIDVNAEAYQTPAVYFNELFLKIKTAMEGQLGYKITNSQMDMLEKTLKSDAPKWQVVLEYLALIIKNKALEKADKKLLLIIDEYHRFNEWDELTDEDDKKNRINKPLYFQFAEFIKIATDEYSKIASIVMAGYKRLTDVSLKSHHVWAKLLGGRVTTKTVENFTMEETRKFFMDHFTVNHKYQIDKNCHELIWFFTAGHPLLMVHLGNQLFKLITPNNAFREDKVIKESEIQYASQQIDNDAIKFVWFDDWIRENLDSKLVLSYLGKYTYQLCLNRKPFLPIIPRITIDKLLRNLNEEGIKMGKVKFEVALDNLLQNGAVVKESTSSDVEEKLYLRYPLFARFNQEQNYFKTTKNDYDTQFQDVKN